jgi:hypothetical protein
MYDLVSPSLDLLYLTHLRSGEVQGHRKRKIPFLQIGYQKKYMITGAKCFVPSKIISDSEELCATVTDGQTRYGTFVLVS